MNAPKQARIQQPYLMACGAVMTLKVLPVRKAWDWWPCITSNQCQGHELLLQSRKSVVQAWNCKISSSRNVRCTRYMCQMWLLVAVLPGASLTSGQLPYGTKLTANCRHSQHSAAVAKSCCLHALVASWQSQGG